jgi:hypothetical protein
MDDGGDHQQHDRCINAVTSRNIKCLGYGARNLRQEPCGTCPFICVGDSLSCAVIHKERAMVEAVNGVSAVNLTALANVRLAHARATLQKIASAAAASGAAALAGGGAAAAEGVVSAFVRSSAPSNFPPIAVTTNIDPTGGAVGVFLSAGGTTAAARVEASARSSAAQRAEKEK